MSNKFFLFLVMFCLFAASSSAQKQDQEKQSCESPVYTSREVLQPAKIIHMPGLQITDEYRKNRPKENHAELSAVLCSNGSIANITIIKGLPSGMDEKLIEKVGGLEFIPAQKDGKTVSVKKTFEFYITLY